ncbi:MAG: PH domain-containing protein [Acidimicrobiales bacterium]|nr:PH domain-containing protein [Acidimicrobiales bacterium]
MAMKWYNRLLHEGEEIVVSVRPHWWYLTGPIAAVVVVIAGAITAEVADAPSAVLWIVLVLLVASVLWLVARYAKWTNTRFMVTTSRIIERQGVFSRRGREIPLSALSNIEYHQSLFERVLGTGDVIVESAGKDSQETFPDLPRPASICNEIYRQVEKWRRPPAAASAGPSIPEQIDQLDQLRRRGVISDAEFEAKKNELLGRL